MNDKLNRLAKGILDEDPPVLAIKPEFFEETVFSDRTNSFTVDLESFSGKNMGGAVYCDEFRIRFAASSFMGRIAHLSFTVDAEGLPDGSVLKGVITLITNAGEFSLSYLFTVRRYFGKEYGKNPAQGTGLAPLEDGFQDFSGERSVYGLSGRKAEDRTGYIRFLMSDVPEDNELLADAAGVIIREEGDGSLANAILREAIVRGLSVTHLFESYLATYPDGGITPMPREVHIRFAGETGLILQAADRLYANVIAYEPEGSALYLQYEPAMAKHAAKSLADRRMNKNLAGIYDRMIRAEEINERLAGILPDILQTSLFTVRDPEAATLHVKYPELQRVYAKELTGGTACLPIYFADASVTASDREGRELPDAVITREKLMDRPDLMRRCLNLCPAHPMLLLADAKEIVKHGIRNEEEKNKLIRALMELDAEEGFRKELIRVLSAAGGDTSWIREISFKELDEESGSLAFRAMIAGKDRKEAYLYLRASGMEGKSPEDLSELATLLIRNEEKPVTDGETDRFFTCLCKRLFDLGRATGPVVEFLTAEYEGGSEEMYSVLKTAAEGNLAENDLPERLLSVLLFTENRKHLDETFLLYLEKEAQKESILRAFFAFRMTDYFEKGDRNVAEGVFDALTGYMKIVRFAETLPVVLSLGLTKHFSEKESLDPEETALCKRLTDALIEKNLIFAYTKKLRKKIPIPARICEKFYVEYMGTKDSVPRMTAAITPGEETHAPMNLKKVYHSIFVASTVLFAGEEMHYLIYDESLGEEPVEEGVISVRKMHGKTEDRFLQLNRMTVELKERDREALERDMRRYLLETEMNRSLYRIGEE